MSSIVTELNPTKASSNENILRPTKFSDYVGQESLKKQLGIYIAAAKKRNETHLDHILVSGPPGLGKTTIAHIIANEMECKIHTAIAPAIERPADIVQLLVSLDDGDILFIDEIHALKRTTEELLYSAMEDYKIDIIAEETTITLDLPKFTLIGATTRQGLLSAPLLDRFAIKQNISYYTPDELALILRANAEKLKVEYDDDGIMEIAIRSRGTPRIANNLLKRVRDYAMIENDHKIDKAIAEKTLSDLGVDSRGLDDRDRKVLRIMFNHFSNRAVGIESIAKTIGEEKETIERVVEPFLLKEELIKRTQKGRSLTKKGEMYIRELEFKKDN